MKNRFKKSPTTAVFACLALLSFAGNVLADNPEEQAVARADALHTALSAGDSKKIYEILAPDVLVFESGGVESSLAEYASHHMLSDMDFMTGMQREVLDRTVFAAESQAVVTTRSRLTGTFRDQEVDIFSAETLVLTPGEDGWQVRHIHWSSRAAE